jgi:23S rRNA (adenine2503-C2)-methyltransferase
MSPRLGRLDFESHEMNRLALISDDEFESKVAADPPSQKEEGHLWRTPEGLVDLCSLDLQGVSEWMATLGEKPYRARQIFRWLHERGAESFDQMTDLKKALRDRLKESACIIWPTIEDVRVSEDGTRKYQMRTFDDQLIESVYIPRASGPDRNALCISSQVGCALGCRFCATAALKLKRHLHPGEIVGQYHAVLRDLASLEPESEIDSEDRAPRPVTNIVYMGMGEPLHNYAGVVQSIRLFTAQDGPHLSPRRLTVSTSGMVPAIKQLGEETNVHIAISLNASTDEVRSEIMPINKRWNIAALLEACQSFSLDRRRRITFEYVMLDGINDDEADAHRLIKLLKSLRPKVNLIPFNPHPLSGYARPSSERVEAFRQILEEGHLSVFVRTTRGDDIDAACGMLGAKKLEAIRQDHASR